MLSEKLGILSVSLESSMKMAYAQCSKNMCKLACMAALCQNFYMWCQGRPLYDYPDL